MCEYKYACDFCGAQFTEKPDTCRCKDLQLIEL